MAHFALCSLAVPVEERVPRHRAQKSPRVQALLE